MKPDWATRLQRTFARKYDAGFAKGLMFGKAVGAADERERILGGAVCSLCHDACQEHGAKIERERIIAVMEKRLCFEGYDCDEDRCKTVMAFIAMAKGELE